MSKIIPFYDEEDINIIDKKIKNIMLEADIKRAKTLDPTIYKFLETLKIAEDYIRKYKRICYGGRAIHYLIKKENKKDEGIYGEYDRADIEFYSPEPTVDMKNLADIYYEKKFRNVRVTTAMGSNHTYKVYADFKNICDISYMPKHLYNIVPTITANKMRCIHPKIIFIDKLKMFNDPMNSFWRLSKEMPRTKKLLKYFPFEEIKCSIKPKLNDTNILDFVRKTLLIGSQSLIVFGFYAFYYYASLATNQKIVLNIPYYDVISIDFNNDVKKIHKLLVDKFGKDIGTKEYVKFYNHHGRKISFYYKNKLILNVLDHDEKCIPYLYLDQKQIMLSPFNLTLMMLMIYSLYWEINRNNKKKVLYDCMTIQLLKYRRTYLKNNKKTVLDKTPFRDFIVECTGKVEDKEIKNKKKYLKNIEKGKYNFNYYPKTQKNIFDPKKFIFDNISGNIIINVNKRFFKDTALDTKSK